MDNLKKWKITAIISLAALLIVSCCYAMGIGYKKNESNEEVPAKEDWLLFWNDEAEAKQKLTAFVEAAVDENSEGFIPEEDRIAVFDLDGTLFCETDPVYFDYQLFLHRATEDPTYEATDFEKETAAKIQEMIDTGVSAKGLEVDHGKCVASSFAGMTLKEFSAYIQDFKNEPAPGYNNLTRGDAFYLPMVEVLDYLQNNGFTVYIVSGTDRLIVRGIVEGISFLNIPANNIIGSDELITTRAQGDTDGLDYVYTEDDELILAGEFIIKNLKMNKVSVIAQEIGIQPVLSFGNSSGDSSMAMYTVSNNPYPSLAFMLCCDDTVRENGDEAKAQKMYDLCEENGWVTISMKNDWKTIYGEEVTRK
ncbi:MAG: haloacid dehalogenase-like hydrolase [Erysipelotrichaceae bacterium]|nr:haloacid dehalogenase-like hydrolase [Erysipelotrichaceae bacterium]